MLTPSCRGTTDVYYGWSILRDKVGDLPLLAIEADMADTRAYSDVQVKQKLTAFIETIDATRSRRK